MSETNPESIIEYPSKDAAIQALEFHKKMRRNTIKNKLETLTIGELGSVLKYIRNIIKNKSA